MLPEHNGCRPRESHEQLPNFSGKFSVVTVGLWFGWSEASSQPAAKRWEAVIRNNMGYALHQRGRFDQALEQFKQAVEIRERGTDAESIRTARCMVAWTLRALGQIDEALTMQLRLERECEAAAAPDPYVFEELEILYRAMGNESRANHFARLSKPAPTSSP